MSIFDLSGSAAIITGGNGGIGLGIAQALAAAGCNVSIWGRNAEKNKAAAASMAGMPGKVDTRVCDVSNPASVKAAMAATLEVFGRVDGCFANAGIGGGGRHAFIDRTEEQWRQMFATNLDGVFHVFQVAARHMTERANAGDKFGRLVATSSLAVPGFATLHPGYGILFRTTPPSSAAAPASSRSPHSLSPRHRCKSAGKRRRRRYRA